MSGVRSGISFVGVLVLLCLWVVDGSRIILTSPQLPSHIFRQLRLGSELVRRGHDVYVAVGSRYPKKETIEKMGMKVLLYHIPDDVMYGVSVAYELLLKEVIFNDTTDMPHTSRIANRDCTHMMEDRSFLDQVKNLQFNLAVVEPFILTPCSLLLPYHLGIPFISFTHAVPPWRLRIPALPSFYPAMNPFKLHDVTTLIGRLENLLTFMVVDSGILFPSIWNTTLLEIYAPQLGSWNDLVRKSELYLVSSDHYMGRTLPTFPNTVLIEGYSCSPAGQLDSELEILMNGNQNGVVVMSFGSIAYQMPPDVIRKFLEAFSRLRETVVARLPVLEDETLPENVHFLSWMPQNDILGHPNTKLFITHCGTDGQHEALYHGIPMIGFPLFAEQRMNCLLAEDKGFGLTMNIREFTSTELYENIRKVLDASEYRSSIGEASKRFRDQPIAGIDLAGFWVEHAAKYGGRHLRSPANDQPLYQFLMLDILAVLFVFMFGFAVLAKAVVKMMVRKLTGTKAKAMKVKAQ